MNKINWQQRYQEPTLVKTFGEIKVGDLLSYHCNGCTKKYWVVTSVHDGFYRGNFTYNKEKAIQLYNDSHGRSTGSLELSPRYNIKMEMKGCRPPL